MMAERPYVAEEKPTTSHHEIEGACSDDENDERIFGPRHESGRKRGVNIGVKSAVRKTRHAR